ncbi:MAG: DNA-binding protein [Pedosphaera sp.]|nr:DNA-binding protein [Pedosphaera sp.]
MKHLLDVNILLACLIGTHPHHNQAKAWLSGKNIVLCPIIELGFLRISSHKKAYALPMDGVRKSLQRFAVERKVDRIPDDLPALESHARRSDQVTDHYLADLAAKHGFKLATLDEQLKHPSSELIV